MTKCNWVQSDAEISTKLQFLITSSLLKRGENNFNNKNSVSEKQQANTTLKWRAVFFLVTEILAYIVNMIIVSSCGS